MAKAFIVRLSQELCQRKFGIVEGKKVLVEPSREFVKKLTNETNFMIYFDEMSDHIRLDFATSNWWYQVREELEEKIKEYAERKIREMNEIPQSIILDEDFFDDEVAKIIATAKEKDAKMKKVREKVERLGGRIGEEYGEVYVRFEVEGEKLSFGGEIDEVARKVEKMTKESLLREIIRKLKKAR